MGCCDKFVFLEDNKDNFQTWQGLKGAHFTPHVDEDGVLTWTNNGNLQNPEAVNIRGPVGQGLQITGIAESVETLPVSQPIGSVWLVGEESPYEAYAFFGEWIDIGEVLVGPAGPQGPQGEQGEPGDSYVLTENDKEEIADIVIADAGIGSDTLETEAQTIKGAINELHDGKVDKITGKGLSTNDYDNTEKSKVGAAVSDISDLKTKVGTAALDTTNKNLSAAVNELKQNVDGKSSILYFQNQPVSVATNAQIMRIPASGTDSAITTDTVVLDCVFSRPFNILSNITWQSYAGYVVFTGTCNVAITANVVLGTKTN